MTKRVPFGREAFPRSKGGRIEDSFFRRCEICRTPIDTRKTSWSETGQGVKSNGLTGDNADTVVTGGCPFCGTLKWAKSEPKKLPDDRNKPSRSWKLRNRKR